VRRLGAIVALVLSFVVVTAGQALAQYPPSTPPGGGGGGPGGPGGGGDPIGGTDVAFTGTNISLGLLIVAALVVIGVGLLVVGRRRKVAAAKSG
jgi:LPXTG cell wall anchor motif